VSVRLLQLTFEPLVNSSGIWQRGRGLENNYIPANGTAIDSWVMEKNLLLLLQRGNCQRSSVTEYEKIHLEIQISWNTDFIGFAALGMLFVFLFSFKWC